MSDALEKEIAVKKLLQRVIVIAAILGVFAFPTGAAAQGGTSLPPIHTNGVEWCC